MPTKARPQDNLLNLFLSAYDDKTWANATLAWLDQQQDGTVELLATRVDGTTLAIEHTLIEWFIGEREDFERFKAFLAIQDDPLLVTPGKIVYVNVPRGVLAKGQAWKRIVDGVHQWLRTHIQALPTGESMQTCVIGGGVPDVPLQARVIPEPKFNDHPIIRRYGSVKQSDDAHLFTVPVEQELGGETFEELLNDLAASVEHRDWQRVRALDERLRLAVNRVTAEHIASGFKRNYT